MGSPCGKMGTVEDRIRDCAHQDSSTVGNFVLVARTIDAYEIWKDMKSGFLWSDVLSGKIPMPRALSSCHNQLDEVAKISGVNWKLPSIEQFNSAEEHGFRSVLPNMDNWFWSSSKEDGLRDGMYVFNGHKGESRPVNAKDKAYKKFINVRCIGEIVK